MKNQQKEEELNPLLQQFKAELAAIDEKYDNPELTSRLDAFFKKHVADQKQPQRKSARRDPRRTIDPEQKAHALRSVTFPPEDRHLVRYCLMHALRLTGHEIVLHEMAYMRSYADVFAVISGRSTEYEIKVSRADFFADFKKILYAGQPLDKHGLIAAGKTMINRFYFVVPEGLIDPEECPAHAGLIYFRMQGNVAVFRVGKRPALVNKGYLSPGSWQTISKRLQLRVWEVTDRYNDNNFSKLIKKSDAYCHFPNQPTNGG